MINWKKIIIGALSICVIISLFGCAIFKSKEKIVIGLKGGAMGLHPYMEYETVTMSVNYQIFNALVENNRDYKIIPALAQSWDNPDKFTWRFYLRHGIRFHNGYDFTAEDVKYTIEYILSDPKNPFNDTVSEIERIEVVDRYTLDIKTKGVYPLLLNKLTNVMIFSKKHFLKAKGRPAIGTGPYKFVKEDALKKEMHLVRNDDFWGKAPAIKEVVFRTISDDRQRVDALIKGEIDFAESIPPQLYLELKDSKRINWVLSEGIRVIYLGFDMRENNSHAFADGENPTANIKVRKAIYRAINEDKIIDEIMGGIVDPATQFVNPYIFGYNPEIKRLPYNLNKAKRLLKDAGFVDGFEIALDCPNNRYINDEAICREIKKQLKEVNIKVNLNLREKSRHFAVLKAKRTSFYLIGWASDSNDSGDVFNYILRSPDPKRGIGAYNCGVYINPELDKLLEDSEATLSPKKRLKMLQQAFKLAMDDVVIVPLHIQKQIYGLAKGIKWMPRGDGILQAYEIK